MEKLTKLTKREAKEMILGLEPQVYCLSPVRNVRWNGEFNLNFDSSFHVIAVWDYVKGDLYPVWGEVIFEKFDESDGGVLTIITPFDTRVKGNWGGVVEGMAWREYKEYRVI